MRNDEEEDVSLATTIEGFSGSMTWIGWSGKVSSWGLYPDGSYHRIHRYELPSGLEME
jgi:hypothetical protein